MTPIQLVYFANPMCSWCWGFAPTMRTLEERYGGRVEITVALGALGDPGKPMDEAAKARVREHWQHVIELTGQPFDMAFFERAGFVYDTEKPSRAVAAVRAQYPALALPFLHRLQELFYARNEGITNPELLARAAADFGVDRETFEPAFASRELRDAVQREWREVASLGVSGYPTLLALGGDKPVVITVGCRSEAEVVGKLDEFLSGLQ